MNYTAEQVGRLLTPARSAITVRALARRHKIGVKHGRDWLFADADIVKLQAIPLLGGHPRQDGTPVVYKADPTTVRKGRPKSK